MEQIKDEYVKRMLGELVELLHQIYKSKLKMIILYGSVARGTQRSDSDVDIMVLLDVESDKLNMYEEQLSEASTDISLKYLRVLSIVDINYQEYMDWKQVLPFYRNVSEEGVVLYAS